MEDLKIGQKTPWGNAWGNMRSERGRFQPFAQGFRSTYVRGRRYQAVRTHLVGLSEVFTPLERQHDVPAAEKLAREFADDFRLLEDIGWHEDGSSGDRQTAAQLRVEAAAESTGHIALLNLKHVISHTAPREPRPEAPRGSDEHAVWIDEVFAESISGFAHLRELMRPR